MEACPYPDADPVRAHRSGAYTLSIVINLPTTSPAGEVVFDGVRILVSPGAVMTPVLDTVGLVDVAVESIGSRSARVADVGTGTGVVAVAVALRAPSARIWATDDSRAAVALARENVARHNLQERVHVLPGNLLDPVPNQLDLVLANLPYHAEARSRGPDETANRDQPAHAIYAPGDGLQPTRELIRACRTKLEEDGCLAIQLYGSVLSARRPELDQLLREVEARGAQGWEARAAAAADGSPLRCEPWRATARPPRTRAGA
jgi:release factor glutamine methyltransferase